MFNNKNLANKVINTFVTISGEQLFYDIVRKDGTVPDVDRHFLVIDRNHASGAIIQSVPIKNFPEHHKPQWYHFV